MVNEKTIFTSVIAYSFNMAELNLNYSLILTNGINKDNQKDISQKLSELPVVSMISIKIEQQRKYLVLLDNNLVSGARLKSEDFWQLITFEKYQDFGVYKNHIIQLIINQLNLTTVGKNVNRMPYYLISYIEWMNKKYEQRYAVKVTVDKEQNLSLRVVTFSKIKKTRDKQYYYFDAQQNRMIQSLDNKEKELFEWSNGTRSKNTINYMNLEKIEDYNYSKVGLAGTLLQSISENHSNLFEKLPYYLERQLLNYQKQSKKTDNGILWHCIAGQQINIYADIKNEQANILADRLEVALLHCRDVQQEGIKIVRANHSVEGLNIQAIDDVRGDRMRVDAYEVSSDRKIIQHVTVQGFGDYRHTTQEMVWMKALGEENEIDFISKDNKINKLSQELVVRRDILQKKLTTVSNEVLLQTAKYVYFDFQKIDKNHINVARMTVDISGVFQINVQIVNIRYIQNGNEFDEICQELMQRDQSLLEGWGWSAVLGCVKTRTGQYLIIKNTEQQIMPNEVWVREQLSMSNPKIRMNRQALLDELKRQLASEKNVVGSKLVSRLETMISGISNLQQINVSIKEVKDAAKEIDSKFNWQGNMRKVSDSIAANLKVAFLNDVFLGTNENKVQGFYGVGLLDTTWQNSLLYFVGSEMKLKKKVARAIRLKRIGLLNISKEEFQKDVFPDFIAMMTVKFVRNAQSTVIPYPFKYLREYRDLGHHQKHE